MMDIVREVTSAARNVAAMGFNEPFIGDSLPQPREVNLLDARAVPSKTRQEATAMAPAWPEWECEHRGRRTYKRQTERQG